MPRSTHFSLAATTVKVMTVNGRGPIRIINRGSVAVYLRADRDPNTGVVVDPGVNADDSYVVAPGAARLMDCADEDGIITIKVIASAICDISVEIAEQIGMGY